VNRDATATHVTRNDFSLIASAFSVRPPSSPQPASSTPVITMSAPSPAAIKARIINHMNADHADSVEDYLKFYNSINAAPQSAKLIDLNLDSMEIGYIDESGVQQTTFVKILPPMGSLAESRVKLVAMAEEATGKSFHQPPDIPNPSTPGKREIGWARPKGIGMVCLVAVTFGYWALSHEFPLSPDGPLQRVLPGVVVDTARRFREQLFAVMFAIHLIEGSIIARKCLEEGLSLPLVVLWTVNVFFEGGPAMMRFNKMVRAKQ
jgi:hypothetical protein